MKNIYCLIFCLFLCSSCVGPLAKKEYKPGVNPTLSPVHREVLSHIVSKPAPKGKSPKGRWIFMVTAGDGHKMEPFTVLSKNILDANGRFIKSQTIKEGDLSGNEFLHAGFITLEEGDKGLKGYDLTGYGKVKLPYTGLKVNGNELEWDFTWFPASADKRNFMSQEYHRVAKYDPTNDVLYGTCSMRIYKEMVIDGAKKMVIIPVGQYAWKASRLSEEDFQAIANTGKRHPGLPKAEYTVYVNTKDPGFKKGLIEKNKAGGVNPGKAVGPKFVVGAGFVNVEDIVKVGGKK